jgi:ketosteroid isomerase-like protein
MVTTHETEMMSVAKRLFAAITAGDLDAVRGCYAPDATVWHNTDGVAQNVDDNLRVLGWIAKNVTDFRYEDARCQATATGFVEQHLTCGTSPNGTAFAIPACIVATVVDGLVTRIDEYLDSAQTVAIAG